MSFIETDKRRPIMWRKNDKSDQIAYNAGKYETASISNRFRNERQHLQNFPTHPLYI